MTTLTLHGKLIAPDGLAQQIIVTHDGRSELRRRSWATRPQGLRPRQPRSKLRLEHQQAVGEVVALERDAGGLWATCTIEASQPRLVQLATGPWYYSPEIDAIADGCDRTDVILTGIGLVRRPAQLGLDPLVVLEGELDPIQFRHRWRHVPGPVRDRLERAVEQTRSRDSMLTVRGSRELEPNLRELVGRSIESLGPEEFQMLEDQRPVGPWRHGGGGRVLNVR